MIRNVLSKLMSRLHAGLIAGCLASAATTACALPARCETALTAEFDTITMRQLPGPVADRYPYGVTFLPEDRLDSLLNYAGTDLVPIIFKRDKTDLLLPNTALDSIVDVCNRVLDDPDLHPAYIWIGGSASPEGPYPHNVWLGKTRASRLYDYLKSHTQIPDSMIRIDNLAEDWDTPLRLIERANFPNKDKVLDIYRTEPDILARKRKVISIDNGVTWEYLIDNQFRPARNARIVIVCSYPLHTLTIPKASLDLAARTFGTLQTIPVRRPGVRYDFVALKTNLAALGLLVANLGVEFSFGRQFSLDLPFYYSPYDITERFRVRILGVQPELRYWLKKGRPGDGHFFGLNGTVAGFNVSFPGNDRRYQDPEHALWGVGISYGYALNFGRSKRWGLEFNIGAGYFNYRYDTFENHYNGELRRTSGVCHYWGLTRVGISLTYKWWRPTMVRARIAKGGAR